MVRGPFGAETGYVRRKSGEKEVFQMERPNEQTGKPTKPPPLSQGLSSTGIAIPHDAQSDILAQTFFGRHDVRGAVAVHVGDPY